MTISCQASNEEGVTTIGSSPSTVSIGTTLEVRSNYFEYFGLHKSRIEYGKVFKKGKMKGWQFEIVKDIV